MADEGDSKSLVLITRVGSTPTTGIASSSKSKGFGLLFFFSPHIRHVFTRLSPPANCWRCAWGCYKRRTEKGIGAFHGSKGYGRFRCFFVMQKEMFSWIACSNSSNRAQEKNAASVIARVQELVLFAIRRCVIAREHTNRQNKKVSPTWKMEDYGRNPALFHQI